MAFLGFMTVREHEAVKRHQNALIELRGETVANRDATIGRLEAVCKALRTELATLKAERDGLLNERDILSEACNEAATTRDKAAFELAFWKKHGQLRDPATGRLIPKAKPGDVFTASHSPA